MLVPGKGNLDAGFDAVQVMLVNLGRSGALILFSVDSAGNRIDQLNEASPGGVA